MAQKSAISPTRQENYADWYQEVIKAADLAEASPTRGCMVIKPWGYALWEGMQQDLDRRFKETGHRNAYFPLLIPLRFLEQEAEHVEGFAKECAVVTHHRLEPKEGGGLQPAGPLEEPYIIRPTSETIIGAMYAKWVQSWRDLPVLINQWANVMRWEMRTRLFLRTAEFLWQEGHTVHASAEEAVEETMRMLDVYHDFAREVLAMPVIKGEKTPEERFPGAVNTYTIEAMMQDGKALQAGTSHFLGQNFSKAQGIKFSDTDGVEKYGWTTSWGVSTRMVGGLIMTHSDDDGLVLPPRIAPEQVVILPIYRKDDEKERVLNHVKALASELRTLSWEGLPLRVAIDDRPLRGGEKMWQNIKRGVPVRLEIGPRDLEKDSAMFARRDEAGKNPISMSHLKTEIPKVLSQMQAGLLERAETMRLERTKTLTSLGDLKDYFSSNEAGFALVPCHAEAQTETETKPLRVSARCIPLEGDRGEAPCAFTGKPTTRWVIFAKAY